MVKIPPYLGISKRSLVPIEFVCLLGPDLRQGYRSRTDLAGEGEEWDR